VSSAETRAAHRRCLSASHEPFFSSEFPRALCLFYGQRIYRVCGAKPFGTAIEQGVPDRRSSLNSSRRSRRGGMDLTCKKLIVFLIRVPVLVIFHSCFGLPSS